MTTKVFIPALILLILFAVIPATYGFEIPIDSKAIVSPSIVTPGVMENSPLKLPIVLSPGEPVSGAENSNAPVSDGITVSTNNPIKISPAAGLTGKTLNVTIRGTNFEPGASTVSVSGTDVTVGAYFNRTATKIACSFIISPTAKKGKKIVTVTNPTSGVNATGKFIVAGRPSIVNINPAAGLPGKTYKVTLRGSNFEPDGSTVSVSGTGVTVGEYYNRTATKIVCSFIISSTAKKGKKIVTVTNPSTGITATGKYNVVGRPSIVKINPPSGRQGMSYTVTIKGSNFEPDASTVSVSGTGVTVGEYSSRTDTQIICPFIIASGAKKGARTVTITNPTTGATVTGKFRVTGRK